MSPLLFTNKRNKKSRILNNKMVWKRCPLVMIFLFYFFSYKGNFIEEKKSRKKELHGSNVDPQKEDLHGSKRDPKNRPDAETKPERKMEREQPISRKNTQTSADRSGLRSGEEGYTKKREA